MIKKVDESTTSIEVIISSRQVILVITYMNTVSHFDLTCLYPNLFTEFMKLKNKNL